MERSVSFGYADDMKINFHFSFPRTGSTMFLSYMRANPRIETGYAEPNHLFHLVTKVARWKKQYAGMGVSEIRRLMQLEDENCWRI